MCGICGSFTLNPRESHEIRLQNLRDMMRLMERRGPDDEGTWIDEQCAFGFRRLAIIDLTPTGHQPMLSEDSRHILVFNGELYNFTELRTQLEAKGYHFRSTGDSEVALYSLVEWGVDALEKFNGMFALAFYNTREKSLLLARDHAGIKPLYFLHGSHGLVFASQYNQVVQHPWAENLGVSQDALSLYLRFGWIPAPYAVLEQTHLLEAGSWLKIYADGHTEQGNFFNFPKQQVPSLRGTEAIDALDEALDRAVRRHLISDVPVGVFLSGGIDSPLVAAKARQISGQKLQAFTIGVDDPQMDESDNAQEYSRELDLEITLRMTNQQTALDMLDDVIEATTEPSADFSIFPTLLVSQLASEQVKVVLTGDGGDELFWGYPGRFVPMLQQARYFDQPKLLRYGSIAARKFLGVGYATHEVLYPTLGRLFQKKHTLTSEQDLAGIFPSLPELPGEFSLFEFAGTGIDETAQWTRWNEYTLHLARVLMKADRASMHQSLETRLPLLDREVIDVAIRMDWRDCLDLDSRLGKIPLRKVLARSVKHQTQTKKGFTVPMHTWLKGPLQGLLVEKVINQKSLLGQEMNNQVLREQNLQLLAGNHHKASGLWLLLSLALWQDRHMQRKGA